MMTSHAEYRLRVTHIGAALLLVVLAPLLMHPSGIYAAETATPLEESGSAAFTAVGLTQFLDRFVPDQLSRHNIAGAVIVAVHDDSTVVCRGYGYANVADKLPMSSSTLVRPGSISKLFTSIAVMQLAAESKLDLDRDVNDYLDFRIETPQGGVPVTLRLLLTHRAGFENHLKGLFVAGSTPLSLGDVLSSTQPTRLFPHGDVPAYSNYGYSLAGYIVERAAGMPFEDYLRNRILQPLEMTQSTFVQPLPLTANLSRGYRNASAPPLPYFESIIGTPAGGMSVNGEDMSRFMRAVLSGSDARHIRIPSQAGEYEILGLEEDLAAGNRFLGKHGLTLSFVSEVAWLPEQKFGLFVSYNSSTASGAPTELLNAVAERFFKRTIDTASNGERDNASAVTGVYQPSQRADSNLLRFITLATQQIIVTSQPDGSIRLSRDSEPFAPTAANEFRSASGQQVVFGVRRTSGVQTMSWSSMPLSMEWERVPWYLQARIVMPSAQTSLAITAITVLAWPIAAYVRRRRQRDFGSSLRDRRDYAWTRVVLVVHVLVFVGLAYLIGKFNDITQVNASLDPLLYALFGAAWLSIALTVLPLWFAFRFWRDRVGSPWARVHQTLLAVSAAILAWFWFTFRIAGTTLNF
jgi:CubicO group peptidase (beta-lactamase class C family)